MSKASRLSVGLPPRTRKGREVSKFTVGITGDFGPDGAMAGWIDGPVAEFLAPHGGLTWHFLPPTSDAMASDAVSDCDAVITGEARWVADSFAAPSSGSKLALVASWGIGVDGIDLKAASEAHVAVTNSPNAGNHASVAESALMFVLALSKRLITKDRLTQAGRGAEAPQLIGSTVEGRIIATVGFGATARRFAEIVKPLRPSRILTCDPYVSKGGAEAVGVELVTLETVMKEADYVVVMCTLTDETRGLIGAEQLQLMKRTACIVNTARGPIIDQAALTRVLASGEIAGAGLDVTDPEPPLSDDPILGLDNVIVTSHAAAWTSESLAGACIEPCRAVEQMYQGQIPRNVVNRDVIQDLDFLRKLPGRGRASSQPR
jgi:phosphoglycerate dehydrogenase-like enzyme